MNKKRIIIPTAAILILGVAALLIFKRSENSGKNIKGSGTIEVTQINVASKITGRIKKINTDEGQRVKLSQMLVKIEADEVSGKLDEALAAFNQAMQLLKSTKAKLLNTLKDLKRLKELYKAGSIPKMQLDSQETKYIRDLANYNSASAGVMRAKSSLGIAKFFAKEHLVLSPINGTVIKKYFEEGELVMPGSILLSCANLKNVYLKIYIPEYKLGMIKLGQKVKVSTDTYKNKIYYGKITQISQEAEFTPKNIQTEEERVRLVFGVKVTIQNDSLELKPGMPADAEIIIE